MVKYPWILAVLIIVQLCTHLQAQIFTSVENVKLNTGKATEESNRQSLKGRTASTSMSRNNIHGREAGLGSGSKSEGRGSKSEKGVSKFGRGVRTSEPQLSPALNQLIKIREKGLKEGRSSKIQNQLGRFVPSLTASQTVGKRGPILLKDTNFIEHLAHFDRERIPERVVHARGMGAFGTWKVTGDITKWTKACVFKPGSEMKILIRFSTVGGKSGSPDLAHDPRGFAIKFYTPCGIWDLPGNNLETFPINDPIFFPSLIHSRKKNPQTNCDDPNAFWDFTSLRPETTMHTIQLFSYLGYPDGLRFMDGAGVHTYKLVNAEGKAVYCKFHFISKNGYRNLTKMESAVLAGRNPEYSTQDLFEAIERQEYPSWELNVQIMSYEEAASVPFNPFDITKVWDRNKWMLKPVGIFTLNKNPVDYFKDIEMAAFDPGNLIPGIEMSPDRMLQGRSFSYSDTQRYRLGANFLELPVNRPTNFEQLHTYQRDGAGLVSGNGWGLPNYFPNSFYPDKVDEYSMDHVDKITGDVVREDAGHEDNFSHPKIWYCSRTAAEKSAIASNIANDLKPVIKEIQDRALANFGMVSPKLKTDIEKVLSQG